MPTFQWPANFRGFAFYWVECPGSRLTMQLMHISMGHGIERALSPIGMMFSRKSYTISDIHVYRSKQNMLMNESLNNAFVWYRILCWKSVRHRNYICENTILCRCEESNNTLKYSVIYIFFMLRCLHFLLILLNIYSMSTNNLVLQSVKGNINWSATQCSH